MSIVVMGVAGCGKSTLARALSARLGVPFLEGDKFHPRENVEKMASGIPLHDADRWPWLAAVRMAMRDEPNAVVTCSALRRSYRDALRAAGDVRFVFLAVSREEITRRLAARQHHYMHVNMVASQFETLEPPAPDETDVAVVPATGDDAELLAAAERALATLRSGTAVAPLLADGAGDREITQSALEDHVRRIGLGIEGRRILLVPPDHTRLHSRSGEIAGCLYETLTAAGREVGVLPALGTHAPMSEAEVRLLFGDRIPFEQVLVHRWRDGVVRVGELAGAEIAALSRGRYSEPIPVEIDQQLLDGWDLVISIGQVVPHEVVGTAGFTKNVVIGLGGATTIHRSHFLGAVCGMETLMGRAQTPVRDAIDAAFDRHLADRVELLWILTVIEDTPGGVVQRGLFTGRGGSGDTGGAAYRAAAELAARCNIVRLPAPLERVVCRLDPAEFRTTWLGNKAIYRTRMAIADGGELIVLAPGVTRFGDDPEIDALIRRHGYRGTSATREAVESDVELAANLGAAAHLIHGSSEGRFRITYCTDPDHGGLTAEEVEGVGYSWRPLGGELEEPYFYIANPALGLWAASSASSTGAPPARAIRNEAANASPAPGGSPS
jgi:carbohydrate kinase (thermoresistant glucokinase family)